MIAIASFVKELLKLESKDEVLREFSAPGREEQKLCYIYNLLLKHNIGPEYVCNATYKKSLPESVAVRLEGNSLFQRRQYNEALVRYSKSIAKCPFPPDYLINDIVCNDVARSEPGASHCTSGNELAFAFGNRSAVLYAMGRFDWCLKDIERAQALNCPPELTCKLLKRKVNCIIEIDAEDGALQSCEYYLAQLSLDTVSDETKRVVTAAAHETEKRVNGMKSTFSANKSKKKRHLFFENLKVSHGQHEKIPCASKCIDVGFYETMGRGLVATRDIAVGDVLLIEEPFGGTLFYDNHCSYCHHCFMFCLALIPCYRCSVVMFCSESCRKESWEQYHHIECYVITCNDIVQQDVQKLALRITVRASASQHNSLVDFCSWVKSFENDLKHESYDIIKEFCCSTDYRSVYQMMTNSDKVNEKDMFVKTVTAVCLVECLCAETTYFCGVPKEKVTEMKKFVGGLLLKHMNITSCNSHQIAEYRKSGKSGFTKHGVGVAVYPIHSLLNHSCSPNVVRLTYKGKMALFARRPIMQGQQIFDCYKNYYTLHDIEERQHHLEKHYFFKCKCEACIEKWPTCDYLPDTLSAFKCQSCGAHLSGQPKKPIVFCTKCKERNDLDKVTAHIMSSYIMVKKYLVSTPRSNAYMELPDPLICMRAMCSLLQDWEMYIQPTWKLYDMVQEAFVMALDELSSLSMV